MKKPYLFNQWRTLISEVDLNIYSKKNALSAAYNESYNVTTKKSL